MINHLAKRGAEVVYGSMNPPIHVSGHASSEELKLMLNLVKPRYFVPDPRRIPAARQACVARAASARARPRGHVRTRDRRDAGTRSSRRPQRRTRHGRSRVHRLGIAGRRRGGHDHPRPAASVRRRFRSADHRDQQTHGQERDAAGDREPRLRLDGWRRRGTDARSPPGGGADARIVVRGGAHRLGRDAGEDPRGPEAVPHQADLAPAADHAGDPRGLMGDLPPAPEITMHMRGARQVVARKLEASVEERTDRGGILEV